MTEAILSIMPNFFITSLVRFNSRNSNCMRTTLILLLGIATFSVYGATYTTTIMGIKYRFNYDPYNISNCYAEVIDGSKASGVVFIESTYEYNNRFYPVRAITKYAFSSNENITSVIIPTSITEIQSGAFMFCENLTTVDIYWNKEAENLQKIGGSAFWGCGLKGIAIPPSVKEIMTNAFDSCEKLTVISVNLSNPFYSSYDGVLYNKAQTEMLICPNGKTSIEISPKCRIVNNLGFSKIESVVLPESVTTIGEAAFFSCMNLHTVNIPESVTIIKNKAFESCDNLHFINIPESVKTIGERAFGAFYSYNENKIENLNIPKDVTEIGKEAFSGCKNLVNVRYLANDPIEGLSNWFPTTVYSNATLILGPEAIEKARTIEPWKNFAKIECTSGIEEAEIDADADMPIEIFNINGLKVGNNTDGLVPGIYIKRQGNKTEKVFVR